MDQGSDQWDTEPNDHDGGWHIPHLYVIDLDAGDFTDQTFLEDYSKNVVSYRLNKLIMANFSGVWGWKNVPTTLANFPTVKGSIAPGENQLDPRGEIRMHAVRNEFMSMNRNRLYIAANGLAQTDQTTAFNWDEQLGVVYSLSLDDPTDPSYLRTLMQHPSPGTEWDIHGMDVLPANGAWIDNISGNPRNVLVMTLRDHNGDGLSSEVDRLWIAQDP